MNTFLSPPESDANDEANDGMFKTTGGPLYVVVRILGLPSLEPKRGTPVVNVLGVTDSAAATGFCPSVGKPVSSCTCIVSVSSTSMLLGFTGYTLSLAMIMSNFISDGIAVRRVALSRTSSIAAGTLRTLH